jgi:hypothetical protein
MRHLLTATVSVTPQSPGRTPQRSALRLPSGEDSLPRCYFARLRHDRSEAPPREAMK